MSLQPVPIQNVPGVPDYTCTAFLPKSSDYCLLIPVINEGSRILTELGRAQKAGVDRLVDIVICDGGSTDGSMKRETLDALLGAMDEYLPKFWQYLRAKGKALGHENGLPWYELFAPMGKSDKKYTTQDAKDYLLSIFSGFDSQLHDMVERAFDEAWIDFYPRNGKVGGAFDCGVPSARQSRVLTNFDGAFGDIVTLAHELGHAFHDQQVFSHPLVCQEYTMPVAETASTFNEAVSYTHLTLPTTSRV
mgnify:CR=1 FL=1